MKLNSNPITWPVGADNMGGYKAYVLVIPFAAVKKAPTIPSQDEIEADADAVTASGSFEFLETSGISKPKLVVCTDKTVSYNAENQGEIEGQSYTVSGEFFRAGNQAEAAAFARQINNTPCYLVIEDMDGRQQLIGQPFLPATIKPAFEGGQNREDRRGFRFAYSADSVAPVIYLETPIDVDELMNPSTPVGG